jgi:hypothetical protein
MLYFSESFELNSAGENRYAINNARFYIVTKWIKQREKEKSG